MASRYGCQEKFLPLLLVFLFFFHFGSLFVSVCVCVIASHRCKISVCLCVCVYDVFFSFGSNFLAMANSIIRNYADYSNVFNVIKNCFFFVLFSLHSLTIMSNMMMMMMGVTTSDSDCPHNEKIRKCSRMFFFWNFIVNHQCCCVGYVYHINYD